MHAFSTLFFFLIGVALSIQLHAAPPPSDDPGKTLAKFSDFLVGRYTNTKQYTSNPEDRFHVTMSICSIWSNDATVEGRWFYVEHAMYGMEDSPIRQYIWQVTAVDENTVSIAYFDIANKEKYAASCRGELNNDLFDNMTERDLSLYKGCELVLTRQADGTFEGRMGGYKCEIAEGAGNYLRSEIKVSKRGITLKDQGFDLKGEQVWGPVDHTHPYQYKKVGL